MCQLFFHRIHPENVDNSQESAIPPAVSRVLAMAAGLAVPCDAGSGSLLPAIPPAGQAERGRRHTKPGRRWPPPPPPPRITPKARPALGPGLPGIAGLDARLPGMPDDNTKPRLPTNTPVGWGADARRPGRGRWMFNGMPDGDKQSSFCEAPLCGWLLSGSRARWRGLLCRAFAGWWENALRVGWAVRGRKGGERRRSVRTELAKQCPPARWPIWLGWQGARSVGFACRPAPWRRAFGGGWALCVEQKSEKLICRCCRLPRWPGAAAARHEADAAGWANARGIRRAWPREERAGLERSGTRRSPTRRRTAARDGSAANRRRDAGSRRDAPKPFF